LQSFKNVLLSIDQNMPKNDSCSKSMFNQKRISANPSPNPKSNSLPNPKAQ